MSKQRTGNLMPKTDEVLKRLLESPPKPKKLKSIMKNKCTSNEHVMDAMDPKMGPIFDRPKLQQFFSFPEKGKVRSVLSRYMEHILFDTYNFLNYRMRKRTKTGSFAELLKRFSDSRISDIPQQDAADVFDDLVKELMPHGVNVSSPYFVGHMTSALPFFMTHLKALAGAMNQNVVKLETSGVFSVLERQLIAKIHRLIYARDDAFYRVHIQNPNTTLGCFTDGGTSANMTALWTARMALLGCREGFEGVEKEGLAAAYNAHEIDRCVVLVSRLGHYSLIKAGGLLGIGRNNIIPIDVDGRYRIRTDALYENIAAAKKEKKTKIIAVVGMAGATETGTIDPLRTIGEICSENGIHFHVDAAWGGPTLVSESHRSLLDGIDLADSVTIDGHKQFYMPVGCGMVYFKHPSIMDGLSYCANYIIRNGSGDLGVRSLSGSREANSLILDSALKIMGLRGYAALIEHGIHLAKDFAREIKRRQGFQLVTEPDLNILTYRLFPAALMQRYVDGTSEERMLINEQLNEINRRIQDIQKETGKGFVSRTKITQQETEMIVLRVVIANPMTTLSILKEILDEQEKMYQRLASSSQQ